MEFYLNKNKQQLKLIEDFSIKIDSLIDDLSYENVDNEFNEIKTIETKITFYTNTMNKLIENLK
jgi:hypothetical protein